MPQALDGLDISWIERGLLKRKSNYSPVLLMETTDPKRIEQLKSYGLSSREYDRVLLYDPWRGLLRLTPSGVTGYNSDADRSKGDSPLGRRLRSETSSSPQMRAILKSVDAELRSQPTLFIMQNISDNREWDTGLQAALRSWATDPQLITQGSTVMLQTADSADLLDAFTRELVVVIEVESSTASERRHVIGTVAHELEVSLERQDLTALTQVTAGLNLHQLESVLLESYYSKTSFDLGRIKGLKSELVKQSGTLEIRDPQFTFDDIGGYHAVKSFIQKNVIGVLRDSERAKRLSLPLPKGILFFGPPGTGKSLFANALASEIDLPFIHLLTENIYSKWFGESGQRMKSAIQLVEKVSPALVFVDEIDRFGKRMGSMGGSADEESRRVFSQFLEWLGRTDRQAIIVGTTNVPDQLDEAFLRTGRFDYKIPFFYPGEVARLEILWVHLGQGTKARAPVPLSMEAARFREGLQRDIVPLTEHFSGAELEELVVRAKRIAFERHADVLSPEDLLQAARTFRIDQQQRRETLRESMNQVLRFTDDQEFLDSLKREIPWE